MVLLNNREISNLIWKKVYDDIMVYTTDGRGSQLYMGDLDDVIKKVESDDNFLTINIEELSYYTPLYGLEKIKTSNLTYKLIYSEIDEEILNLYVYGKDKSTRTKIYKVFEIMIDFINNFNIYVDTILDMIDHPKDLTDEYLDMIKDALKGNYDIGEDRELNDYKNDCYENIHMYLKNKILEELYT